jgi:hypothetical protein
VADLAERQFDAIAAPTLLIVGEEVPTVLEYNRAALDRLACAAELHVVEGAGHLFEGARRRGEVATVAGEWFGHHLCWKRSGRALLCPTGMGLQRILGGGVPHDSTSPSDSQPSRQYDYEIR